MELAPELFEKNQPGKLLLRCIESGQPLIDFAADGFLFCPASRLRYPVTEDGIPVMLLEEAHRVAEDESLRLLELARARQLFVPEIEAAGT